MHQKVIVLKVSAESERGLQGQLIRLAREAKRMTQKELGDSLNVSRATISAWEKHGIGNEIYDLEKILDVEKGTFEI